MPNRKQIFPRTGRRRGNGLLLIMTLGALFAVMIAGLLALASHLYLQGGLLRDTVAVEQLLEGGLSRARAELRRDPGYEGSHALALGPGEVRISITGQGASRVVRVTAAVPNLDSPRRSGERRISAREGGL